METYNILSSIEDVKRVLRNLHFSLDKIASCLAKMERFIVNDYRLGYLTDPSPYSVKTHALISSNNDHCGDGSYFYFWF